MQSRSLGFLARLKIKQSMKCHHVAFLLPCRNFPPGSTFQVSCRWKSRIVPKKGKTVYPERLLVYHVGPGKTTIVGCIKVTTIMAFAFACLVAAPAFYNNPDSPLWAPPAAIAVGAIPMIFVSIASAPFVSTIHLRIPPDARVSKDRLMKYTQILPPSTQLDITAMRLLPWPKTIGTRVSELRPFKSLFSIADMKRAPHARGGSWRSLSFQQKKFYVGEKLASKRSRAPGAWDNIMRQIRKRSTN